MASVHRMPWGKFKGLLLEHIESSYLAWCLDNAERLRPDLRAAIVAELRARFGGASTSSAGSISWRAPCPDPAMAAEMVSVGFRVLAKRHHPDVGGNTGTMQLLNATADWLKRQVPQ